MAIYEHLTEFMGIPVTEWAPGDALPASSAGRMVRVSCEYDDEQAWPEKFAALLEDPRVSQLAGIVVGAWVETSTGESPEPIVEALVAAREKLPNVRAIFVGDILLEESEISWINQTDVSPLLNAYPRLEHFGVRGGAGLSLGGVPRHANLRTLIVQSGGLDAGVVQSIGAADLPSLEHLELWLGDSGYGATTEVSHLAPILRGDRFPKLRTLGLKDSEIADDVAAAVAAAPVLAQLDVLDLSMGTLGDAGARALLASPSLRKLKKLDIHYHYCSDEVVAELKALGIEVDASEEQGEQEPDDRYVQVSE